MKRIFAFILLCVMLAVSLGVLSACGGGEDPGKGPGGTGDKTFIDNLGDRNYNGEEFVVSVLDTYKNEVYAEEDATAVLDEAVYKRNRAIEDRFNVKIVPDITLPDNAHLAHISHMQNAFNGGSDSFDVGMLYVYKAGILVIDQMLYEQRHWVPHVKDALNNGSDWWSADMNNAFTVQGNQYVSVSDWCITAMSMTYAMVFNKQYEEDNNIASNMNYTSMYDIVRQKHWTIDLLRTMTKDLGEDLNDDDAVTIADDFLGFICDQSTALDQFAPAFNINYIINDGETTPELFTLDTRAVAGFEALYQLFYGAGSTGAQCTNIWTSVGEAFTQGRAFIAALPMERYTEQAFHDMEDDYGILPYPMLSREQKNYYSGTVDNYSVICILAVHAEEHMEFVGTMIEALSAETHNSVVQPYYDLIVTHNSTRDEESIEMIEIIMAGRLYDLATLHYARLYYTHQADPSYNFGLGLLIRHSITYKFGADITSHWTSVKDQVSGRLDELVDEYVNMYA